MKNGAIQLSVDEPTGISRALKCFYCGWLEGIGNGDQAESYRDNRTSARERDRINLTAVLNSNS